MIDDRGCHRSFIRSGDVSLFRCSCAVCARAGPALCTACARRLEPAPSTRVRGVGRIPGAFAYAGVGAQVVQALKFRDGRRLVGPIADVMAATVADEVERRDAGWLTWLPTTARHRRDRGFDQSELLARALSRRLGLPVRPALRRPPGASQTGRSRAERQANVTFLPRRDLPVDRAVVAVDDVCTTGATARAAVAALAQVGALTGVVVAARTP